MKAKRRFLIGLTIVLSLGLIFTLSLPLPVLADVPNNVMGQPDPGSTPIPSGSQSSTPRVSLSTADGVPDIYSNDNSLPARNAVDVASYQSWMTQNDFNLLKAAGVKTVVVKLTEGGGANPYVNPYAAQEIRYAQNAGLIVAAYHYADFTGPYGSDPASEANFFVNNAQKLGLPSNTVMVLDMENNNYQGNWTQAAQTFAKTVQARGYSNVKFYTALNWTEGTTVRINANTLGLTNMWIAEYTYAKPSANALRNTQFGAWQFSNSFHLVGSSQPSKLLDVTVDYAGMFGGIPTVQNAVYRMYNPNSGEHFYTTSNYEASSLQAAGWNYEGVGWKAPLMSTVPVYRLYNPNAGDHFYTTSSYERDTLVKAGWKYENIAFYSAPSGTGLPVYRAYNPNATTGAHNYTLSSYEQQTLVSLGWHSEGTAWYALGN